MTRSIDLGEENLNIKNMFTGKKLVDQIISYINQNSIHLTICHNVYHHFPLWELFSRIKKETKSKLWLYLHDYKIACPVHSLMRSGSVCEKCHNKQFYKCTLYKCKSNSYLKSFILTAESYYHNYFKDVYSICDLIVSPSFFLKNKAKELGFPHPIQVLRPPIEMKQSFKAKIKNQGPNIKKKSLLFLGRLSKQKGIDFLIDLVRKLPEISFNVAGDGPLKEKILKDVNHFSNLNYLGYIESKEILKQFSKNSFLLMTSVGYENYPISIVEAMSYGLPVIGTSLGGVTEQIKEGGGILLDPGYIDESTRKIRKAFSMKETAYQDIITQGKKFAQKSRKQFYSKFNAMAEMN